MSLIADAIDFAGDALDYGVSLAVLALALAWRALAAMLMAISMMGFGIFVLVQAAWSAWNGGTPDASTMGLVGVLALVTNVAFAWMLFTFRESDANMRSVWLYSCNDAIGNMAVLLAALGVFGTGQTWPGLIVASLTAAPALHGGWLVLRQARGELRVEDDHGQGH